MSAEDTTTIRRLRDVVRALEDENERLREVLQSEKKDELARRLIQHLNLSLAPARFLAQLYLAGGAVVPHSILNAATGYHQKKVDYRSTDVPEFRSNVVYAHLARKVCPHIQTEYGVGFRLLPEGIAFIRKILDDAQSV